VDEPTEQVPSADVPGTHGRRAPSFGEWLGEAQGAMGPRSVVVLGIGPERPIEVPATEDEYLGRVRAHRARAHSFRDRHKRNRGPALAAIVQRALGHLSLA
jgi:hypothetical protein